MKLPLLCLATLFWTSFGCSANAPASGSSADPGADPTGGTAGISPGGGPAAGGGGGLELPSGGGGSAGPSCATLSAKAAPAPANVLIVLDLSGSMKKKVEWWDPGYAAGATRYSATRAALDAVIPKLPAQLRVGLVYFGHGAEPPSGCTNLGCCTRDASNGGPDLPIAQLDGAQKDLLLSFTKGHDGNDLNHTPTQAALLGAYDILAKSALDGPKHALLITDGAENCGGTDTATVAHGAAAASGADPIKTFVIGSPGSEAARLMLSNLAAAGGTARAPGCNGWPGNTCHYDLTGGGAGMQQELQKALTNILGSVAVPCTFDIPQADGSFDPGKVNVQFTDSAQSTQTIPKDDSASCDQAAGWQYSVDGQQILLCGSACSLVKSDPLAQIDVLFGCPTVVK